MQFVYKIDRLARNQRDFLNIIAELNQQGVELASASEPFDSSTYMGRAMRDLLGVFAEMEREMIRERTLEKAASTRKRGLYAYGLPPMGYKRDNCMLHIIPAHVPTIKRVYELYHAGQSSRQIARQLNAEASPFISARGVAQPWTFKMVLRVLQQALYAGYVRDGDMLLEGQHRPIIERALWQKTQKNIATQAALAKARLTPKRRVPYPLKSLLTCQQCGKRMKGSYTLKKGKLYRYYDCSTRKQDGVQSCNCPSIQADDIEHFMLSQLSELTNSPKLLASLSKTLNPELREYLHACIAHLDTASHSPATQEALFNSIYASISFDSADGSISFKFKDK